MRNDKPQNTLECHYSLTPSPGPALLHDAEEKSYDDDYGNDVPSVPCDFS